MFKVRLRPALSWATLVAGVLLVLPQHGNAQAGGVTGLAGIHTFGLSLDGSNPDLVISEADLQTHIELKLRSAGLPVVSKSAKGVPDAPFLWVRVAIRMREGDLSSVSFLIDIRMIDWVLLSRASEKEILADVYGGNRFWVAAPADYKSSFMDFLDRDLETFMNDYLKANPRPSR